MARQKTNAKKIAEGRCTGIGASYVPFFKASEAKSIGTASMIPDLREGRMIHTLSATETDLYYMLRWDDMVEHIREQYLLDTNYVNEIRLGLGLKQVPANCCYTTDFLVDYKDGSQHAYSVKFKRADFNPDSIQYRGKDYKYKKMIEWQNIERLYWQTQGIGFSIVTSEDIDRVYVQNIAYALSFYDPLMIHTREQKLMYLLAHKVILIDMHKERINPKRLSEKLAVDIDSLFEETVCQEG